MKNLPHVKFGLILAVLAMLFGFGLGALFGASEATIKDKLKADGEAVITTIYKGDTAEMDKVVSKSWAYMLRAHLHGGVLGIGAVAMIMLIAFSNAGSTEAKITSIALGAGALLYGLFWMMAGFKAPSVGSTGLGKEAYRWLAWPGSGAYILATLNVLRILIMSWPLGIAIGQIGHTWLAPAWQRTALNSEAKLLLLGHAFDVLGCASVGLQTSTRNTASRAAIARLGATLEGVTRHHLRHNDGSLRDTANYSIIDGEWPTVKAALLRDLGDRRHD